MSEPVFVIEANVQYEWAKFALYRHPREPQQYASASDSGCSCNYWTDPTEQELEAAYPMSRASARLRVRRFFEAHPYYFEPAEAVAWMESLVEEALNEAER